jgi:hypothetical protein
LTPSDIAPGEAQQNEQPADYVNIELRPAAFVQGYTAAQKPETSVPASGMSASISIADPSSVNQSAPTLCNSMVSGWESIAIRIRSQLAASKTASTLSPFWY